MSINRITESKVQPQTVSIDLQLNLLNTWTKSRVADYYQNIFLAHLDQLLPMQAEQHIKKQIKLTLQRKSLYFELQKQFSLRKNILSQLRSNLPLLSHPIDNQSQLSHLCQLLTSLRNTNLNSAELILKMFQLYHCSSRQSTQKQMQYYDSMFQKLDSDHQFLKSTSLRHHIKFEDSYDPFFMSQYEQLHRNKLKNMSEPVKQFYSMNISQAYKLMKIKNNILELRSTYNRTYEAQDPMTQSITVSENDTTNPNNRVYLRKREDSQDEQISPTARMTLRESQAIKIKPIQVYPSPPGKYRSRTTVYNDRQIRPQSSQTEIFQGGKLKFVKIGSRSESKQLTQESKPYPKRSQPHLTYQSRYNSSSKPSIKDQQFTSLESPINKFHIFKEQQIPSSVRPSSPAIRSASLKQGSRYRSGVGQIYRAVRLNPIESKPHKIEQNKYEQEEETAARLRRYKRIRNQRILTQQQKHPASSRIQPQEQPKQVQKKSQSSEEDTTLDLQPKFAKIQNYNPITKKYYSRQDTFYKDNRYDFNPKQISSDKLRKKHLVKDQDVKRSNQEQDNTGLSYQTPISKHNKKFAYHDRLVKKQRKNVDQECQTIELKEKEAQTLKQEAKKQDKEGNNPIENKYSDIHKTSTHSPSIEPNIRNSSSNTQINPQNIHTKPENGPLNVPQNPTTEKNPQNYTSNAQSTSKNVSNNNSKIAQNNPDNADTSSANLRQTSISHMSDKRQIKMKIGKSTVAQVISILQKIKLTQKYRSSFQLDKLIIWIKVNQTYMTQFVINQESAIIALCSPVPNIGMAIKFWAPIKDTIDQNTVLILFKKYVQFVQKSTTSEKILFSGKPFPQLMQSEFTMKKQNLFQRKRKTPAKQSTAQFQPFLYVQCSNIRFEHPSPQKILYSQQIEQFTVENAYAVKFMGQVSKKGIPSGLESMIKYTPQIPSFTQVNKILTSQDFDNYQTGEINVSNIDLIRLYFNSPFKTTFVAQQGYFKFTGILIHQKDKQCMVSIPLSKPNYNLYLCKNLAWPSIFQLTKKQSTQRTVFSVMMFSKKIYGKMVNHPSGCYGNWEINLTWEDQMQGRIKHTAIKETRNFGPENFIAVIQMEKQIVFGVQVTKQDFIF